MNFKVLKRMHLKRNIILGVVVIVIISAIILNFTRAKYRTTQSIPLVNGTINYSAADLNIVAITVDGEPSDTIPSGNYELTEDSYCTVNGEGNSSITINYDMNNQKLTITPFTTKGTKCYLDFVASTTKKVETILGTLTVNLDEPDFSKTAQADCSGQSNCEETNGIYEETTSNGTTYYWRGSVDNNWVKFAGFYWRIIRINEDGSLRLIYQGTEANTSGEETQISTSAFNTSYNDNMYVGFKYTSGNVHGTGTNSTILTALNTWYNNNLASYASKLDGNAGFCGDRTPYTNTSGTASGGGTGTTTTYYGGYIRLITNKTPTYECPSEDLYTTSGSSQGNKVLTNPIGLISADEVAYAGSIIEITNQSYYLYTNNAYWTMTPYIYSCASAFAVGKSGQIGNNCVNNDYGVRPVINLKADTQFSSGNGTSETPFVVS